MIVEIYNLFSWTRRKALTEETRVQKYEKYQYSANKASFLPVHIKLSIPFAEDWKAQYINALRNNYRYNKIIDSNSKRKGYNYR